MQLLWEYFKSRIPTIAAFSLFSIVFGLVFAFYRITLQAVYYPVLICIFFAALFAVPDFLRFRRKHRQLTRLLCDTLPTESGLPNANGLIESDYRALVLLLCRDKRALETAFDHRYNDLIEYYTMWVHQIKTPISAMRLLLHDTDTVDTRLMGDELLRIEQYVEMVLCYLRLDSGSTDYLIKEYDLDSIIRPVVRKYASQFIRRRLKLEYEPLNTRVLTDSKWLSFVIEQLLSNALKYTPGGTISVTLEEPKVLCIRDTGIGISPEDMPRIFEKGFTGRNGRKDRLATGIGLYLCRRICSRLGHNLTAQSKMGSGTVVMLNLESAKLELE